MNDETDLYLTSLREKQSEWVEKLEAYAKDNHVPIMEPLGIDFLMQIIRMKKPGKILEIGTAIGYSALQMVTAYPSTQVITIERDQTRYKEALNNIEQYSNTNTIEVMFGDALEVSDKVEAKGPFDVLFIDAAKGQYTRFFDLYTPFLKDDAVIISDNVLFKGLVAKNNGDNKRQSRIVEKIRNYNEWLVNHPDYNTTILPIGDGIAITLKK
ncbi:putative O-methyltransferase YrrM [Paraliobacillus quinghaiensis]|uniref:tRNA 5-hydroxyuridine methyltransferase n=1 Tax=Paraliobacillus quinghaiensis TaxID=470815 RepID=A0A917TNV3_9BACI|nr:O-methyltransferase [Paraliobacillus quinghaiensis]GGM30971.1 putative O-methyltransferase YrrM [Paraliobacillus quinghaiensis]